MMDIDLAVAVVSLVGTYAFLRALLQFTQDTREPLSVEDWIPFLSPMFVMGNKGARFHKRMRRDFPERAAEHILYCANNFQMSRDKYKLPIYTLRLPGSRLYVINDTALIPVLQRQVRTLSIAPIMVRIFSHYMGVDQTALDIMGRDPVEDHGFVHQMTIETTKALAPGPNLDDLNAKAVNILNSSLQHAPTTVKMFEWTSREIMMATTNAVYGPHNPFKDPAVREAYYKLEGGLLTLVTGFLPSLLAKEALKARRIITESFLKYYVENGLEEASVYARNRYQYPISLGVPEEDVARMEAGGSIGLISNTMPATFWTLYHTFSDPVVLKDCREEVKKAIHEIEGKAFLDLTYIKTSCPFLVSTMKEAFRVHSVGTSARAVVEDHLLDGKYLLKKGSTVLIPSTVQHSLPTAWGQDVDHFSHKRFMKRPKTKHNPVAFRAFGGGATLCPGRHFASTEILAFASIILLRFDIKPVTGSWSTDLYKETNAAFRVPKRDIDVELILRDSRKWHMYFSEPGQPMEISTEDIPLAAEKA